MIAGMTHALVLLVILVAAGSLVGRLALPALAALLILTAWNMSEPARWRERLKAPREEAAIFWLTLLLTVLADLTVAISVGTCAGLALRLRKRNAPPTDWHEPRR